MNEKKSSASAREIISRGTWVLIPFLQQKSHEWKSSRREICENEKCYAAAFVETRHNWLHCLKFAAPSRIGTNLSRCDMATERLLNRVSLVHPNGTWKCRLTKNISPFHSNCNLFLRRRCYKHINFESGGPRHQHEKRNWCQWTVNDDEIPISERSDAKIYAAKAYVTVFGLFWRSAAEMAAKNGNKSQWPAARRFSANELFILCKISKLKI